MNSLLGFELSTPVTVIVALVIVVALIGAAAWMVRKFGAGRLAGGRGRQPRLAVIDAASVDGRRKLIIIRRDNVEHLLMIGGPTDVVVETNILRAAPAAQRETPAVRAAPEAPRAVSLTDATTWPPQPEPVLAPRADRPRLLPEEPAAPPPQAPAIPPQFRASSEPPRPLSSADPLIGLAAELARSKSEPTVRPPEPPRVSTPLASLYSNETAIAPSPPVAAPQPIAPDVHLAEMAQRLETALRRPLMQKPDAGRQMAGDAKRGAAGNPPTNGGAGNNGSSAKTPYDNLEQEMASLLGRQPGKT